MSRNPESIVSFTAPDRRALVARLCADLRAALIDGAGWRSEAAVLPWHATAPSFEELPGRVIAVILEEWEEAEAALVEIEFSGYLETDHGPRAWGCLVLDEATPSPGRTVIDQVTVTSIEPGFRFEARIRSVGEGTRRDDD